MNREEKIRFLFEDERMRKLEEQNELLRMRQIIESPSVAGNTIDDDFQNDEVGLNEEDKTIFSLNIESGKALIIEYIGNDWYPGIEYEVLLDGEHIIGTVEREIAPTNNPVEVSYIVRESVEWLASNLEEDGASEARNLGVVTGGKFIPVEYYDKLVNMYNETGFFVSPWKEDLITIDGY